MVDMTISTFSAIIGPAGMLADIAKKLSDAFIATASDPDVEEKDREARFCTDASRSRSIKRNDCNAVGSPLYPGQRTGYPEQVMLGWKSDIIVDGYCRSF